MVCRLIEGFEQSTVAADYLGKWSSMTGTLASAAGRYGNGFRQTTNAHVFARTFDAQPTWVVGFAFRTSAIVASTLPLVTFLEGATLHCGLALQDTTGLLFAYRGTVATVLGTAAAPLAANTWHYLEAKFTIHNTAGVAIVRVNGTPVINLTAQDTQNAGTATANTVRFGSSQNPAPALLDFDDLYVFDTTGSVNTDFAGDCRVERLAPSGAGATTAWTPSAGANYACVDEAPPNADTDYIASSTAAQTDTYAFGNLVTTSGTVRAVQATATARKDDAGARSVALVARPGGTDRLGATQGVGDTYSTFVEVWNTNPDTGAAWTLAETNASEWGLRLIA